MPSMSIMGSRVRNLADNPSLQSRSGSELRHGSSLASGGESKNSQGRGEKQ